MTSVEGMADDRVALVTGASSGIGRGIARRLGKKGLRMAVMARREPLLESLAEEIRSDRGDVLLHVGDVTRREDLDAVVRAVLNRWGRLDVLVNNAGLGVRNPTEAVSAEELRRQFEVNVFAAFHAVQAVLPPMKNQRRGQIVNIGSVVGYQGVARMPVYAATKWALRGLSESWREELYPFGIKVAYVAPGFVIAEFGGRKEDYESEEAEWAMLPDDIAHAVESIIDQGPNADVKEIIIQVHDRS